MGTGVKMFSQNVKLIKLDSGYSVHVGGADIDKLYEKFEGKVHCEIKKPMVAGTEEQNRFMHSLLLEYYKTGMSSAPDGMKFDEFKIYMKLIAGPCYNMVIRGKETTIPKSWADYSKLERSEFIEYLLSEIHQSGAYTESEKIREIIKGAEENSLINY